MAQDQIALLKQIRFALWVLVVIVGVAASGFYGWSLTHQNSGILERPVGLFGGEFTLETTDGKPFTEKDLAGVPTLIYFGYTYCPDVCPTTLAEVLGWRDALEVGPDQLRFIFVTVDPERDTPDVLGKYLDAFSPDFIGLVGDEAETEAAKKAFGVFSQKVKSDENTVYLVDHTASVFLLRRDGRFEGTIAYGEDREAALAKLRRLLQT